MNDRAIMRTKIESWFDAHTDEMLSDLGKLIAINSVRSETKEGAPYGVESREVLALAQSMLEERGFEVKVFEI